MVGDRRSNILTTRSGRGKFRSTTRVPLRVLTRALTRVLIPSRCESIRKTGCLIQHSTWLNTSRIGWRTEERCATKNSSRDNGPVHACLALCPNGWNLVLCWNQVAGSRVVKAPDYWRRERVTISRVTFFSFPLVWLVETYSGAFDVWLSCCLTLLRGHAKCAETLCP